MLANNNRTNTSGDGVYRFHKITYLCRTGFRQVISDAWLRSKMTQPSVIGSRFKLSRIS
ncbi:hypothetical protein ACI0FR_01052 [Paenochrobactrum sp. BZR 201-1]